MENTNTFEEKLVSISEHTFLNKMPEKLMDTDLFTLEEAERAIAIVLEYRRDIITKEIEF